MLNCLSKIMLVGSAVFNPLLADPTPTTYFKAFPDYSPDGLFMSRLYDDTVSGSSQASYLPSSGIAGNYQLGDKDTYFSLDRGKGLYKYKVSEVFSGVSSGSADKTIVNYEIRMTFGGYDEITKNFFPEYYIHYPDGSGLNAPYFLWASFNATAGYVGDIGGIPQYRLLTNVSYGASLPSYCSAVLYGYLNLWISSGCFANGQVPAGDTCYNNKGLFQGNLCANSVNPNSGQYREVKGSYTTISSWSTTQITEHKDEYIYFGMGGYDSHGNGVQTAPLLPPLSYSAFKSLPSPGYTEAIHDQGYSEGHADGKKDGIAEGYNKGYKDGYKEGSKVTGENATAVKWVNSLFDGMADLLNVQIFPGVTLGFFLLFPIALGVLCLLIKFLA